MPMQCYAFALVFLLQFGLADAVTAQTSERSAAPSKKLEISRTARPWEFLAAVGKRAGLLGNESGKVEAWVYPLKILRDLRLTILTEGREIPAETLVRTLIARPESTTLVYASDTFAVRETFFVPVDQPGAVIEIQVETEQPLDAPGIVLFGHDGTVHDISPTAARERICSRPCRPLLSIMRLKAK